MSQCLHHPFQKRYFSNSQVPISDPKSLAMAELAVKKTTTRSGRVDSDGSVLEKILKIMSGGGCGEEVVADRVESGMKGSKARDHGNR
ncbi:hypothetical protein JCM31598_00630 [Desulfonatronum parangueonense]